VTAEPLESSSLVELAERRLRGEILSVSSSRGSGLSRSSSPAGSARAGRRCGRRCGCSANRASWSTCRGAGFGWHSCRPATSMSCSRCETCWSSSPCGARSPPDHRDRACAVGGRGGRDGARHGGRRRTRGGSGPRAFHLGLVALAGHRHLLNVYEPVILKLQLYMATYMRREASQRPPAEGAARHHGCTRRCVEAIRRLSWPSSRVTARGPTSHRNCVARRA